MSIEFFVRVAIHLKGVVGGSRSILAMNNSCVIRGKVHIRGTPQQRGKILVAVIDSKRCTYSVLQFVGWFSAGCIFGFIAALWVIFNL